MLDGVTVLGHFQHCSVIRLSCLDELLNNDILLSLSLRDMFSKEGPVFWWNLWLMKVDVLFCLSLEEMTTSLWMEFCKRGVEEKS